MTITIHQPEYVPWLGFFDRVAHSDIFVVLDHVQFQRGFINRNRIKTSDGSEWLTVPIQKNMHRKAICEVLISNETDWGALHLKKLLFNYSKTPYFKMYAEMFNLAYKKRWETIMNLDMYFIRKIMEILEIKTNIVESSSLGCQKKSTDLLIEICEKFGADTYLSGTGGKRYMDLDKFKDAKINVRFQHFDHPTYNQHFNKKEFIPNLSIIDALCNYGKISFL